MIYTVAPYLMPELIVKLSTLAPKMPVYLEETYTTELISQLRTAPSTSPSWPTRSPTRAS